MATIVINSKSRTENMAEHLFTKYCMISEQYQVKRWNGIYIKKKLLCIDFFDISATDYFCDPGQLIYSLFYSVPLLWNESLTTFRYWWKKDWKLFVFIKQIR